MFHVPYAERATTARRLESLDARRTWLLDRLAEVRHDPEARASLVDLIQGFNGDAEARGRRDLVITYR